MRIHRVAWVVALCAVGLGAGCGEPEGALAAYGAHITPDTISRSAFAAQLAELPACSPAPTTLPAPPSSWHRRQLGVVRGSVRLPDDFNGQRTSPAASEGAAQNAWVSPRGSWLVLLRQRSASDAVYTITGTRDGGSGYTMRQLARVLPPDSTRHASGSADAVPDVAEGPCRGAVGGRTARLVYARFHHSTVTGDTLHLTSFRLTLGDGRALYGSVGAHDRREQEQLLAALARIRIEQ
jgi:hypothetical protein